MNTELSNHLAVVRKELEHASSENYLASAPATASLRAVMESYDAMSKDLEEVAHAYAAQLKAVIPLIFYARAVSVSARPGKHGRAYIAQEAADKLKEAVKNYGKVDSTNRVLEQPPIILDGLEPRVLPGGDASSTETPHPVILDATAQPVTKEVTNV